MILDEDLLDYYMEKMETPNVKMSLKRCHHPNIDSVVLENRPNNTLLRMFIATGDVEFGEVAIHTHRFGAGFFVLTGELVNWEAFETNDTDLAYDWSPKAEPFHKWNYHSPLLGGSGLSYERPVSLFTLRHWYGPLESFHMEHHEAHTVSCKAGTAWIVSEGRERAQTSLTYTESREPFTVDGLYEPMTEEEVEEALHKVAKTIAHDFIDRNTPG